MIVGRGAIGALSMLPVVSWAQFVSLGERTHRSDSFVVYSVTRMRGKGAVEYFEARQNWSKFSDIQIHFSKLTQAGALRNFSHWYDTSADCFIEKYEFATEADYQTAMSYLEKNQLLDLEMRKQSSFHVDIQFGRLKLHA